MRGARLFWILCGAALASGCRTKSAFRRLDPELNRMLRVPRYDVYEESNFFENGMTMRTPPPGTQPYGVAGRSVYRLGTQDGTFTDRFPIEISEDLLKRGRGRFERTCSACHGTDGNGNDMVTRFMMRPAPSLHLARIRELTPGKLFFIISNGYGFMPGYSVQLNAEDRWAVAAYVKVLELSQYAPLASMPPELRQRVERRLAQ